MFLPPPWYIYNRNKNVAQGYIASIINKNCLSLKTNKGVIMKKLLLSFASFAIISLAHGASSSHYNMLSEQARESFNRRHKENHGIAKERTSAEIASHLFFKVLNQSGMPILSITLGSGTENLLVEDYYKPLVGQFTVGQKRVTLDRLYFIGHELEPLLVTFASPTGPVSYTVQPPYKGWLKANGGDDQRSEQELTISNPNWLNAFKFSIVSQPEVLPYHIKATAGPEFETAD